MRTSICSKLPPLALAGLLATVGHLIEPPPARGQLYGSDYQGRLFIVNTATGAGTPVCTVPVSGGATEIEYDPATATLWTQGLSPFHLTVGTALNCAVTSPAAASALNLKGLEFAGGVLYGAGRTNDQCMESTLWTLDPATGATVAIGQTGIDTPITGLAYDPGAGVMYGITGCLGFTLDTRLVTVNLATGAASPIGPVQSFGAESLEFGPDGNLYAGGDLDDGGNLYRFTPPFTGAAVLVGPTGFTGVTGLALYQGATPATARTWGETKIRYRP